MKKIPKRPLVAVTALFAAGVLLVAAGPVQNVPAKIADQKIPPPSFPLPCPGPDLAITQMSLQVQNINGQWWVVTRGQVSNKGGKDYDGKLGQAVVQLTRKFIGSAGAPSVMTIYNVTHLAKGSFQFVQGSFLLPDYIRDGCAQPLKPTECCREVQLILKVVFDPDIRSDNNPNNDDCNAANDTWPDSPAVHVKFTAGCLKQR